MVARSARHMIVEACMALEEFMGWGWVPGQETCVGGWKKVHLPEMGFHSLRRCTGSAGGAHAHAAGLSI